MPVVLTTARARTLAILMHQVQGQRRGVAVYRVFARVVEVELEQLVGLAVYLQEAPRIVVGLERMTGVDGVQVAGLVAEPQIGGVDRGRRRNIDGRLLSAGRARGVIGAQLPPVRRPDLSLISPLRFFGKRYTAKPIARERR